MGLDAQRAEVEEEENAQVGGVSDQLGLSLAEFCGGGGDEAVRKCGSEKAVMCKGGGAMMCKGE